jgi:hypothetical protein
MEIANPPRRHRISVPPATAPRPRRPARAREHARQSFPHGPGAAAGSRRRRIKTRITQRLLTRGPRCGTAKPTPATGYRAGNGRDPRVSAPARPLRR